MRHIRQPEGSNLCGQAVIAMLGNMTLYEAIEFLGTKGSTTTKQMVEALRAGGFKCKNKLKRLSKNSALPELCIVNIGFSEPRGSHWAIAIWDDEEGEQRFYDPGFPYSVSEGFYYEKGGRITSYLEISKAKNESDL